MAKKRKTAKAAKAGRRKTASRRKPAARKTARRAASKPARKTARKPARKRAAKPKPEGIAARFGHAVEAVLDTLTDAERLHAQSVRRGVQEIE